MSRWRRSTAAFLPIPAAFAAVLGGCAARGVTAGSQAPPSQAAADPELDRIRSAVQAALGAAPPRGYAAIPAGVRLRSVVRRDAAIVMDFNAALLGGGTGKVLEDSLHQIFLAASSVRPAVPNRTDDYRVLVDGLPLETYLR
jgi:hypothetical protein